MLEFDHITVVAPTLEAGVDHVRACLDLDIPAGGKHPEMGTHNHVLCLGEDVYLEVIAIDPAAPEPRHARWFGLGDRGAVAAAWEAGLRLRTWVVRTDDMDPLLARHGEIFGQKTRLSRDGRDFLFAVPSDGSLPAGGIAPSVIDRGGRPSPVARMPDLGAVLRSFVVEHPEPERLLSLYRSFEIDRPPEVRHGLQLRYLAEIETPSGRRTLF